MSKFDADDDAAYEAAYEAKIEIFKQAVVNDRPRFLRSMVTHHVPDTPPLWSESYRAGFALAGPDGQSLGQVFGYSLKDFKPDYDGDTHWISPILIRWAGTDGRVKLFDTKTDGYHGEIGCASHVRGQGEPTLTLRCSACGSDQFQLRADVGYWSPTFDLVEDAELDGEPIESCIDSFGAFRLHATCATCGGSAEVIQDDL